MRSWGEVGELWMLMTMGLGAENCRAGRMVEYEKYYWVELEIGGMECVSGYEG
jgi:hypothetical protein